MGKNISLDGLYANFSSQRVDKSGIQLVPMIYGLPIQIVGTISSYRKEEFVIFREGRRNL
jgi:hypothetical protein